MRRVVQRVLPDGTPAIVQPFHVSLKGLESLVLCRDDEDYGIMVKYIAICSRRKNVLIIIYAVVSNHIHAAVLARKQQDADAFAQELKRIYSMWFSNKYVEKGVLRRVDAKAIPLENDWHVRNALAYIPRNAEDNGCAPHDYKWSGFSAMFRKGAGTLGCRNVAFLTKRERESIMHTGDNLNKVSWTLDDDGDLTPESFCDVAYLEQAFNHDASYFYKAIGSVNTSEMKELLVDAPRRMLPDSEFFKLASDTCIHWFSQEIALLPKSKKCRVIPFLWRTRKTTVAQLARVFGMERDEVRDVLRLPAEKE